MSIVSLAKITWYGLLHDKEKTLKALQALECLHIVPLSRPSEIRQVAGPSQQVRDALNFLLNTKHKAKQVYHLEQFDAEKVGKEALKLREVMTHLSEERDFLHGRIHALKPWGHFTFLPLKDMNDLRFWFYAVPHKEIKNIESRKGIWKIVQKDHQFFYVIVIAKDEPQDMPVARVHVGSRSLDELRIRLKDVDLELKELREKKKELTKWCTLYKRNLFLLENQALCAEVGQQALDREQLFAIQAWAPQKHLDALRNLAKDFRAALKEEEPLADENPPTLLENHPFVASGEGLVTFYMTPGYRTWDPSFIVFISFAIFFAMILSDAGYALLLSFCLAWKWKVLGRTAGGKKMRSLLVAILGASIVWGIMVGGYFGVEPPEGTLLRKLKILDINNSALMMLISVGVGVIHISIANIVDAWRKRATIAALVPIGWLYIVIGGFICYLGAQTPAAKALLKDGGICLMGIGALLLIIFAAPSPNIFKRISKGIFSLARLNTAFGDVLSYMRLFALGLAGTSLAVTFNGLGKQAMHGVPVFGIIFAILIIFFGHVLNLGLSIMSCVVHGLRLNVIEFFNWSLEEDGKPFRPFAVIKK